jgi:hypothetical protein
MWWVELDYSQDPGHLGPTDRNPLTVSVSLPAPGLAGQNTTPSELSVPELDLRWDGPGVLTPEKMREAFPTKLLVRILEATPEQLAAFGRILDQGKAENGNAESSNGEPGTEAHTSPNPRAEREAPAYMFRRSGRLWDIIFAGGGLFHLENTLGARYLDYLFHTPNDPILAFGLEVTIEPAKGEARATNSIQAAIDPQARRDYVRALRELRADKAAAQAKGDPDEISRLEGEILALESALNERGGEDDTGERARGNVRRAIDAVVRKLLKGGKDERALAEHIRDRVSTGYECVYIQPEGRIWT